MKNKRVVKHITMRDLSIVLILYIYLYINMSCEIDRYTFLLNILLLILKGERSIVIDVEYLSQKLLSSSR